MYAGTDYGIAISDDDGPSFNHVMVEASSDVAPDRMQNAVRSVLALPGDRVLAATATGVYRSDTGARAPWNRILTGNFAWGFKTMDGSPDDPDHVFILEGYWPSHSSLWVYEAGAGRATNLVLPGGGSRGPMVRVTRSATAGAIDIWVGTGIGLWRATRRNIDEIRVTPTQHWVGISGGIHSDVGHLGVDSEKRPVLYGCDGGLFRPTNADATSWASAALHGNGMNSLQITDLAGHNVRSPATGTYETSLYFTTQDNNVWASADNGRTWPASDCAEGFHAEVIKDAADLAQITVAYGKIGCSPSDSMFSDAHLRNRRAVPNFDEWDRSLTNVSQAFFVGPNAWVRWATPAGAAEIWMSRDNALHLAEAGNALGATGGGVRRLGPARQSHAPRSRARHVAERVRAIGRATDTGPLHVWPPLLRPRRGPLPARRESRPAGHNVRLAGGVRRPPNRPELHHRPRHHQSGRPGHAGQRWHADVDDRSSPHPGGDEAEHGALV